jgi:hypothetical protein
VKLFIILPSVLLNLSIIPFDAGWYAVVLVFVVSNNLQISAKNLP